MEAVDPILSIPKCLAADSDIRSKDSIVGHNHLHRHHQLVAAVDGDTVVHELTQYTDARHRANANLVETKKERRSGHCHRPAARIRIPCLFLEYFGSMSEYPYSQ